LHCSLHFLADSVDSSKHIMDIPYNKERYSRHLLLKSFGTVGQEKLSQARVLVIGAGGLGCPALQYLAAAGLGHIGIADDDTISLSNLQRQILYHTEDVGLKKATVAAARLKSLNPDISIQEYLIRVDTSNALELFSEYDIIVDGTDNFTARYLINDACAILEKPLVFAAVYQFEGQLAVFNFKDAQGNITNYRDLFESPPAPEDAPDCNEAGVLGVLPGVMGVMQATEVIKLITGIGKPLVNQLLIYQSLTAETYTVKINPSSNPALSYPATKALFENTNYAEFCNANPIEVIELEPDDFYDLAAQQDVAIIDVREYGEVPEPDIQIPLSLLQQNVPEFEESQIILFCQSGKRSLKAASLLISSMKNKKRIYSLKGGILTL
jgi:molybdopterin/thiamine biosynthesis adenylyltransferase/rhodanese-related sulfurtransferase